MIFTSHHDAPVVFPDAMRVIACHRQPHDAHRRRCSARDQRVEPIVALKATTLWAAYQHFEEKTKGSIEVGKLADFVVAVGQPADHRSARSWPTSRSLETIKEGKSVYTRPGRTVPGQEE